MRSREEKKRKLLEAQETRVFKSRLLQFCTLLVERGVSFLDLITDSEAKAQLVYVNCYLSFPSPNILTKASLSNREAGRELGLEPPPVVATPGDRNGPLPVDGFVRGTVSSAYEDGREGLGVRTLKWECNECQCFGGSQARENLFWLKITKFCKAWQLLWR